jgi:hypothetical protein
MGTEKENRPMELNPERKAWSNRNWGRKETQRYSRPLFRALKKLAYDGMR